MDSPFDRVPTTGLFRHILKRVRAAFSFRVSVPFLAILAILPAGADTQVRVGKMTRRDVPIGRGECDIRVRIDHEGEVSLRGDVVSIRTDTGREGRDDGSECNAALPNRNLQGFKFEARDSHGAVQLVSKPSRANDYVAVVRIRGGEEAYRFRVTWLTMDSPDYSSTGREDSFGDQPTGGVDNGPGGLVWNNAIHFKGRGHGTSAVSGGAVQRLSDVTVDIDRGGRILVSFRADGGRRLTLSGSVIGSEGDSLKADVATEDSARLRGSLHLSRNSRGDVSHIALDATDGQTHLHLGWDSR